MEHKRLRIKEFVVGILMMALMAYFTLFSPFVISEYDQFFWGWGFAVGLGLLILGLKD